MNYLILTMHQGRNLGNIMRTDFFLRVMPSVPFRNPIQCFLPVGFLVTIVPTFLTFTVTPTTAFSVGCITTIFSSWRCIPPDGDPFRERLPPPFPFYILPEPSLLPVFASLLNIPIRTAFPLGPGFASMVRELDFSCRVVVLDGFTRSGPLSLSRFRDRDELAQLSSGGMA